MRVTLGNPSYIRAPDAEWLCSMRCCRRSQVAPTATRCL